MLCAPCDADLPRLGAELCPRCALASPGGAVCGRCLTQPPAYDATQRGARLRLSRRRAGAGAQVPRRTGACAGTGRPACTLHLGGRGLHRPRAALGANGCAAAATTSRSRSRAASRPSTGARLAPELCERRRDTAAQMDLPLEERAKNVRGAFHCPRHRRQRDGRRAGRRDDHRRDAGRNRRDAEARRRGARRQLGGGADGGACLTSSSTSRKYRPTPAT